jgi:hypothetical protein
LSFSLIVHISNADPVIGEVEELPRPVDTMIILNNPRRLDGKDVPYLAENATTVMWPIERLNFIEVLSEKEDEEIFGFVRE